MTANSKINLLRRWFWLHAYDVVSAIRLPFRIQIWFVGKMADSDFATWPEREREIMPNTNHPF